MTTPRIVEATMPTPAMRSVLTMPTHRARPMLNDRSGRSTVWMPSETWMLAGSFSQS